MIKARVVIDGQRAGINFNYNADIVAFIKSDVPHWGRSYDPATHCWTVDTSFLPPILRALRTRFGDDSVQVTDNTPKIPPKTPNRNLDWVETLFGAVPADLHEPVFKALIRVLHPDTGGDQRLAQQLIDGYNDIKRPR